MSGRRTSSSRRMVLTLNRRLVLETQQEVSDGAGGCTTTWAALGTLWGRMAPRAARATNGETGEVSTAGFTVIVRAAPVGQSIRPVPGQRFRIGTRLFAIDAVTEDAPGGFYLRCICSEEVST